MHPNDTTLNDYVDGSLGAAERHDVEQHLAGCARVPRRRSTTCARFSTRERDAGAARAAGARVVAHRARESSWKAPIAARTAAPSAPARGRRLIAAHAGRSWLAAAAVLVLAAVVGAALRAAHRARRIPRRRRRPPRAAPSASSDAAQSIEAELRQAESHYEKAIKGLEAIANSEQARARSADRGDAAEEPRRHRPGDQRKPRRGARRSRPASRRSRA